MEVALIGTITNLTQKVLLTSIQTSFSIAQNFVSSHHEQINEVLLETDLISKLEIVQALMHDTQDRYNDDRSTSIQKSLQNLGVIVENISLILKQIEEKIQRHKLKYFSSWRSLNYEKLMNELKKNIKLLDIRYHMFLGVLQVKIR
jgi:hypothetical protein